MNWKKALASEDKDAVIEALNLELTSLQKTILTQVTQDDHAFTTAVETATPGRLLLDIKRSGKYKCMQGRQARVQGKQRALGRGENESDLTRALRRTRSHARTQARTRDYTRDTRTVQRVTTNAEATV